MDYQPIWSQIVADLPPGVTGPTPRELIVALEFIGTHTDATAADYLKFREEWKTGKNQDDKPNLCTFAGPSKIVNEAIARAQELNEPVLAWIRERYALILPSDQSIVAVQRWVNTDNRRHLSDEIHAEIASIPLDRLIEYDSIAIFQTDANGVRRAEPCPCCDETWSFRLRNDPASQQPAIFVCDACGATGDAITWRIIREVALSKDDAKVISIEDAQQEYNRMFNDAVTGLIIQHRSGEFL